VPFQLFQVVSSHAVKNEFFLLIRLFPALQEVRDLPFSGLLRHSLTLLVSPELQLFHHFLDFVNSLHLHLRNDCQSLSLFGEEGRLFSSYIIPNSPFLAVFRGFSVLGVIQ
jgi:hypothetical protein